MRVSRRFWAPFKMALAASVGALLIAASVSAAPRKAATDGRDVSAQSAEASKPAERPKFTEAEQSAAVVPGMQDVRFWADSEADFIRAMPAHAGPWLVLSGGGADGAFGSGVLNGWSQAGTRPEFAVVTGISTGGLIATFAFLGSGKDENLRQHYTSITAADIFEIGGTGESLFDTWPLKSLIAKQITAEVLAEVAAEHRRGRRLFVVTSNLDAERSVVWNMGAIAAQGGEPALKLYRQVLLASASLPGMFPPVAIDTDAKGKSLQELHAEGGLGGPFFVAPRSLLSRAKSANLPVTELYIVLNSKIAPDFYMTQRNTAGVLARSIAVALKAVMRSEINFIHAIAQRDGFGFNVAFVEDEFAKKARGPFDTDYMKALFERAVERGREGTAFRKEPPAS
jgi:hypothetical protein